MIDESDPKTPTNPYGQTKLMFELMLKDFHHGYGLNSISLRYFCAAGSDPEGEIGEHHLPETHVIPLAIEAALNPKKTFQIFGSDYKTADGTAIRDYIHVQDLAQAHILALKKLDQENSYCEAFNLGIERGFSVKEIVVAVEKVTKLKINAKLSPRRPGDPTRLVARSQKAQDALHWKPEYTEIEKIIETAYRYLKNKP